MRKIAVINYKGGTGKTCTVVNIAHGLARRGKKVLLIDTDPQGSAGYHLGLSKAVSKTLYDLLIEGASYIDCRMKARENLDVICANERLYPAEILMAKMKNKELLLKKALSDVKGYDYILLDCAPSMNLLNQNALFYADELLLPVSMDYLSLVGVKQLLKNVHIINQLFSKKINISKVIPTFYDQRNSKSKEIMQSLDRVFPGLISYPIRTNVSLSEAPGLKQTIFEYDSKSKGAEDYQRLVEEVIVNG